LRYKDQSQIQRSQNFHPPFAHPAPPSILSFPAKLVNSRRLKPIWEEVERPRR